MPRCTVLIMPGMVAEILGGIGLFLLGMVLMTDALKLMAGDSLRRVLSRFVGGRFSAVVSGAAATALVQSSSATTLTTIGFVSAGLITFPQAVGVIFGANLGTTSTGWIVSMLGFRLNIGAIALPLVGVGALMRLLLRGRWQHGGIALAGFGLIFVGIGVLQGGMEGLAQRIDPASFPDDTLLGRLLLVVIGALMTVVMQSSSAAVATTLTALHSGAISVEQAGALVIGQNVGTTVKVLIVSIGASVAVRRTAVAHILFNIVTAVVAFAGLGLFLRLSMVVVGEEQGGAATIAAFHTLFNVLGVALFLPWINRFSAMVERIVPVRGSVLTRRLDKSVAGTGSVAVEAARLTLIDIGAVVMSESRARLIGGGQARVETLHEARDALGAVRRFLADVRTPTDSLAEYRRHVATLHAIDHLDRMVDDALAAPSAAVLRESPAVGELASQVASAQELVLRWLQTPGDEVGEPPRGEVEAVSLRVAEERRRARPRMLESTAAGDVDPERANRWLDALHWVDRMGYHTWRTFHHLHTAPNAETSIADAGS
jgi:phosphate:Na+ symporter